MWNKVLVRISISTPSGDTTLYGIAGYVKKARDFFSCGGKIICDFFAGKRAFERIQQANC